MTIPRDKFVCHNCGRQGATGILMVRGQGCSGTSSKCTELPPQQSTSLPASVVPRLRNPVLNGAKCVIVSFYLIVNSASLNSLGMTFEHLGGKSRLFLQMFTRGFKMFGFFFFFLRIVYYSIFLHN